LIKVFIFEAERAWAAAQNIYELAIDAGKSTRVDRDHVTSRFVKAAKIGETLRTLIETPESGASERDILEAIAYSATLSGHAAEHQKKKKVALDNFAIAHMIYSVLSVDDKEKFKKLLTLSVEPQLVRTAAAAGLPRTVKVSATAKQAFPKEERADLVKRIEAIDSKAFDIDADEAKVVVVEGEIVIDSITWRSREAPVDNADIKVALTSAKKSERELNTYLAENEKLSGKEKASAFDKVLAAWQEAVDVVKKDIDEKKNTKDQNSVEMQNALLLNTYVNYNLIGWRISRNVTMGEGIVESAKAGRKLSGLKEQVALYDAILQVCLQIKWCKGC
jgi:signal recognition particle subunit SRP68